MINFTSRHAVSRAVAISIFSLFLLVAPHAHAQFVPGCGGVAVTGIKNLTCQAKTQQCTSAERAVGNLSFLVCPADTDTYWNTYGSCVPDPTCSNPPVTATLTANPSTVVIGNSTSISWSSTNATTCTSSSFNTGGATSGTISVTPGSIGTSWYDVSCTGAGSPSGIKSATVTTIAPPFDASCSVSPTTAVIGQQVTWSALAWNGVAPYTYAWVGQLISGLFGPSAQVAYTTVGTKTGSVDVTDSKINGNGVSVIRTDDQICTGPIVAANVTPGMQEDGGNDASAKNELYNFAEGVYYGGVGVMYNPAYASTYAAVKASPASYCVSGKLTQACNPPNNWGGCNYGFQIDIHSTPAFRPTVGSDFGDTIPDPNGGVWDRTRFYGVVRGSPTVNGQNISRSCTNSVAVSPSPNVTAALFANPVSVTQGSPSTLTWSSTNATSCTGTNFNTGGAVSGSIAVTPAVDTTYTVTCTGTGSPASSSVTVAVTPAACMLNANKWYTGGTSVLVSNENLDSPDDCAIETAGYPYWNRRVTYDPAIIYPYLTECYGVTNPTGQVSKPKIVYGNGTTVTYDSGSACGGGTCKWKYVDGNDTKDLWGNSSTPVCWLGGIQFMPQCASGLSQASDGTNAPPGPPQACKLSSCEKLRKVGPGCGLSPVADLLAGAVTPNTAVVAGTPVMLGTLASNTGTGPSGSFPVLFEIQTPADSKESSYVGPILVDGTARASISYTFPSAATYQVRACANMNTAGAFIVTESDYGNNCGPWTSIIVSGGVQPDLTAVLNVPPAATAGTPVILSGVISNNVSADTGVGFTDLFQRATDSSGTGATDIGTYANPPLASGATNPASLSYTFPSAGTWYIRICADKASSASTGVITESNEGNNCAGAGGVNWTPIVVNPGGSPSLSCTVSPSSLPGTGGTATWTVTPSNGATPPYTWTPIGFSGYSVVSPTQVSHVFTSADAGSSYSMHVAASNVPTGIDCTPSIPVGSVCAGTPTGTLTANPNRIRASTPTPVTFSLPSIQNVTTSCTLSGPGIATQTYSPTSCIVSASFPTSLNIPTQSTYTLTCDGVKTATVNVNVLPKFQEF